MGGDVKIGIGLRGDRWLAFGNEFQEIGGKGWKLEENENFHESEDTTQPNEELGQRSSSP